MAALTITLGVAAICGGWWLLFTHTFRSLTVPGPSAYAEPDPLEAHRWLLEGAELAPRRFCLACEALGFVDRLYTLGAESVRVAWVVRTRHAEGLLITLPRRPLSRFRLFSVAVREAQAEGQPPQEDRGQRYLRLLWND